MNRLHKLEHLCCANKVVNVTLATPKDTLLHVLQSKIDRTQCNGHNKLLLIKQKPSNKCSKLPNMEQQQLPLNKSNVMVINVFQLHRMV